MSRHKECDPTTVYFRRLFAVVDAAREVVRVRENTRTDEHRIVQIGHAIERLADALDAYERAT